eukprot:243891_1
MSSSKQLNNQLPPPKRPKSIHTNPIIPTFQRTVSSIIEEPIPDSDTTITSQLSIKVDDNNNNNTNIPVGLPYIPSPFHTEINNNTFTTRLKTVSESKADNTSSTVNKKQITLTPILIIESSTSSKCSNTPQTIASSTSPYGYISYQSSNPSSSFSLASQSNSTSNRSIYTTQMMLQTPTNYNNNNASKNYNNSSNNGKNTNNSSHNNYSSG